MPDILIVDDSPSYRQQLRGILESDGYAVQEAEDGMQGLVKAESKDFDLIIADLNMPRMNGVELIKKLRQGKNKEVPIFLLTTEGRAEMAKQGKLAGANAWIVKPFKSLQLLNAISRACQHC